MELFDDFGQSREVTLVKTQLAQLREEEEQRITGGTRKKEGRRMGKGEKKEEEKERGKRRKRMRRRGLQGGQE